MLDYNLNVEYDDRALIGDDPNNINDKKYGNADVEGPDALHGTHVGGIVGAVRGNKIGGDGVCENVKLMALRQFLMVMSLIKTSLWQFAMR
ncbi:MAG: S8 family serine peptidase [Crocinitomicaceae bacterium]